MSWNNDNYNNNSWTANTNHAAWHPGRVNYQNQYCGNDEGGKLEADYERGGVEGVLSSTLFRADDRTREKIASFGVASAMIRTFGPAFLTQVNQRKTLRKLLTGLTFAWLYYKYILSNWEKIRNWLMSYALTSIKIGSHDRLYSSINAFINDPMSPRSKPNRFCAPNYFLIARCGRKRASLMESSTLRQTPTSNSSISKVNGSSLRRIQRRAFYKCGLLGGRPNVLKR